MSLSLFSPTSASLISLPSLVTNLVTFNSSFSATKFLTASLFTSSTMLSISFSFSNSLLFSFSSTIKSLEGIVSNTNLFVFVSLFSSTFAMIIPFSFLGNSFLTSISETFFTF